MEFNVFGRRVSILNNGDVEDKKEVPIETITDIVRNVVDENGFFGMDRDITQVIEEGVTVSTPIDVRKMLDSDNVKMGSLIESLKTDYSASEVYKENEEMSKDTIVGSAMEMMADDSCAINPITNKILKVDSSDKKLEKFLNTFMDSNIEIEKRIWEWAYEVVKHGDFKLRRYVFGDGKAQNAFYENVSEGYKVFRVDYMGKVLGFVDEEIGNTFQKPENYIHFVSSKLPTRKKIKIKIRRRDERDDKASEVTCYKVYGTSLVDNARYIYRVVALLDNMLIMSRVARSTQYNVVKIEVGNSSPTKTQEIISDVRRRIEGNTKMNKNNSFKTDPSPIPVNSNIYIPTRAGMGDIIIDSVNESVDVKSIVDIDYFKNKLFAAIKTPKSFMGWEEAMPGSLGNSSLVKLDIRYGRVVQRVVSVLKEGVRDLCNNYLVFRGRQNDVDNFNINMKAMSNAEDMSRLDDFLNHVSIFDSLAGMMETFKEYIDTGKVYLYLLSLMDIDPDDIGNDVLIKLRRDIDMSETIDKSGNKKEIVKQTKDEVDDSDYESEQDGQQSTEEGGSNGGILKG